MNKVGFDNDKYLKMQSEHILERIKMFGGKLYMEFGGKLFDDYHAARVLPGFLPNSKITMLMKLKDQAEIVMVINSHDIEQSKVRGDIGITYEDDVLRLIDVFRNIGLYVGSVVITCFKDQPAVISYKNKLENLGVKVYKHYEIEGYPSNIAKIVSEEGYGKNDYIETTRSLIVVTAPGPGSGKMAVCLSQLYHDNIRGIKAGYSKFETFPIWNLPLKHPVNVAYEAATADLNDVNMIDPFHLESYGITTVNYNRDIEIFPVLNAIFEKIFGQSPYKSPTDMGVNMAGNCIIDDEVVREAGRQEVIRRYYETALGVFKGRFGKDMLYKLDILMKQLNITKEIRPVVAAANEKAEKTEVPCAAIELNDGRIVTGKTGSLLGASSAMLLNALKTLAGIDDKIHLISPYIIEPVQHLKVDNLGAHNPKLHTDELLICLAICAVTDSNAAAAMKQLSKLKCCEVHSSVILSSVDVNLFKKIGVNLTCEPKGQTKKLYYKT